MGPFDLALINGPASHLELVWEEPPTARRFERLGVVRAAGDVRPAGHRPVRPGLTAAHARAADGRSERRPRRRRLRAHGDCGEPAISGSRRCSPPPTRSASPRSCCPRWRPDGSKTLHAGAAQRVPRRDREQLGRRHAAAGVRAQPGRATRAFEEWWGRMQRAAVSPGMARTADGHDLAHRPARGPAARSASPRWSCTRPTTGTSRSRPAARWRG